MYMCTQSFDSLIRQCKSVLKSICRGIISIEISKVITEISKVIIEIAKENDADIS